jgi:hypothetical protein
MLTHMHIVVYTWRCWHIYKGEGLGVDFDQLGEGRKVFRCSLDTRMALGVEYWFDPLWLGLSVHMGCVSLWVSLTKCPRSSKLEFGAKSYRRFTEEWFVTGLVTCASGQRIRSVFFVCESDRMLLRVRSLMTECVRSCRELTRTSLFAVSLWSARPVPLVTCASGQYKFIHAKTSRWSMLVTYASGQFDRCIRSIQKFTQWRGNGHIHLWGL